MHLLGERGDTADERRHRGVLLGERSLPLSRAMTLTPGVLCVRLGTHARGRPLHEQLGVTLGLGRLTLRVRGEG